MTRRQRIEIVGVLLLQGEDVGVRVEEELDVEQEEDEKDRDENDVGLPYFAGLANAAGQRDDPIDRHGRQDPGAGLRKEVDREGVDLACRQRDLLQVKIEPSVKYKINTKCIQNSQIDNRQEGQIDEC